ncbi:hypothetical protein ACFL6U_28245 [Planctomycetota bacterium]
MSRLELGIIIVIFGMLFVPGLAYTQQAMDEGYLLINEIGLSEKSIVYIELYNPTLHPVSLAEGSLVFANPGVTIRFDLDAPVCLPGGLVLLSSGAEFTDLDPNTSVLQVPELDSVFSSWNCITSADLGRDRLYWGVQPDDPNAVSYPNPPILPPYEVLDDENSVVNNGDVILRIPGSTATGTSDEIWAWRGSDHASPGKQNPKPGPWLMLPANGVKIASDFALGVSGLEWATNFQFQIARDQAFGDILIDETVDVPTLYINTLTGGDYFWRCRGIAGDSNGPWSPVKTFTRAPFDIEDLLSNKAPSTRMSLSGRLANYRTSGIDQETVVSGHWVGLSHLSQRKDTNMLCIDGCRMDGQFPWDTAHPENLMRPPYNYRYCVRACLAMIAAQYGNTLSQDRISYYIYQEAGNISQSAAIVGHLDDPYKDLGYRLGIHLFDINTALDWVYGLSFGSSFRSPNTDLIFENPTPDVDSIKEFIDRDRAVIRVMKNHAIIIDGYAVTETDDSTSPNETTYVKVIDPWFPASNGGTQWIMFDFWPSAWYFFPPDSGTPTRVDEPELHMDSDGDGLIDFDEIHRFKTDPLDDDTDGDGVKDKQDIVTYCFDPDGSYHRQSRDIDGDTKPKELDPDNDSATDVTAWDGCEDENKDGFYNGSRETNCMDASDDYSVVNPQCVRGYLSRETHVFRHDAEIDLEYHYVEKITLEAGDPYSNEYIHKHIYTQSLNSIDSNGSTIVGSDSQSGLAKATLELDESTGEYFLITDTKTPNNPFTTTITTQWFTQVMSSPFIYTIDNDARWPLGTPINEGGGRVLKGGWETPGALNAYGPTFVEWEIWLSPPNNEN